MGSRNIRCFTCCYDVGRYVYIMMNVRFNKIKNIFLAALAVLMLFLSFPQVLYAKNPDSSKIYVTDEAEILSDTKESKLQKKCKSVSKNCKTDVAVLTISKGLDYTDLDNYCSPGDNLIYFGREIC